MICTAIVNYKALMKTLPTDMDLLKGFETNWAKQKFAGPTQKTLVAVSGGIDSMALANLFLKAGLSFGIAHCNFQLRGDESDKDEVLVREWAFANNIPFHHTRFETKQKMEEWKKGVQETARMLRYEWFAEVCEEYKYSAIATAHHANDNAETLLMHLFKGTGIAGLHGIPVKNDKIIRPLLFASRKEIEAYVVANNIKYREDASNATDNYLRNEVRHHILPVIEKVFPEGIRHLRDSIERFAEAETIYRKAIDAERKKMVEQRGKDIYIPVLKLQKAEALQTICYELFTPYGFTPAQLPSIISLLTAESGHWVGSATHKVIRNRDFLIITDATPHATDIVQIEGVPCEISTEHGTFHFTIEDKPASIPVADDIAMIDASLLSFPLILRRWKTGDYFYPLGMGMKKKKVSKYFIDQKVPLHVKDKVWVLESARRIVWICGMRLDERFKVKDKTQQVIKIVFNPA